MWKTLGIIILLIILSIYDIKSRCVPVRILAGAGFLSVIYAVSCIINSSYSVMECSLALIPGILFLAGGRITSKIGYGDGFLLIILGLLLGVRALVTVFMGSLFLTGILSGLLLFCGRVRRNTPIPYIPFLTLAVLVVIL